MVIKRRGNKIEFIALSEDNFLFHGKDIVQKLENREIQKAIMERKIRLYCASVPECSDAVLLLQGV